MLCFYYWTTLHIIKPGGLLCLILLELRIVSGLWLMYGKLWFVKTVSAFDWSLLKGPRGCMLHLFVLRLNVVKLKLWSHKISILYRAKRVGKAMCSDVAVLCKQVFQGFPVMAYVECNIKQQFKCCYYSTDSYCTW